MTIDKKILHTISISSLSVLLIALFIPGITGRYAAAIILAPIAIISWFLIRKRDVKSMFSRQVIMLLTTIGVLYLALYYLSGLRFGFYKTLYPFGVKNLLRYVLPISIVILATEVIRFVIRAQESRLGDILSYIICVLAEVLACSTFVSINSHTKLMDMMGMALLPAITSNLLFHYLVKRYGMLPNLIYRVITVLYIYFIPVTPKMPESLHSFIKIALPLVIFVFIDALYEKKTKYAVGRFKRVGKILSITFTAAVVIIMLGTVMLISNQFKYGTLIIATESMTGELNKGDAAIFESYDGQAISVGEVIVFEKGRSMIVHRVVDIEIINGEYRIYTKGDTNNDNDEGYITKSNIVGVVKLKVAYLGYPTIWLKELFSN